MSENAGKIILLDGPSSSGKTTLSKALQSILVEPYWHVSMDMFWFMLPSPREEPNWYPQTVTHLRDAFYQTICLLARRGINVIAEGGFAEARWLQEFLDAVEGIETVFVRVFCSLEEIERREAIRADREVGYSRQQYDDFHKYSPYDMEVNTEFLSPGQAAEKIKEELSLLSAPFILGRTRRTSVN